MMKNCLCGAEMVEGDGGGCQGKFPCPQSRYGWDGPLAGHYMAGLVPAMVDLRERVLQEHPEAIEAVRAAEALPCGSKAQRRASQQAIRAAATALLAIVDGPEYSDLRKQVEAQVCDGNARRQARIAAAESRRQKQADKDNVFMGQWMNTGTNPYWFDR